MRITNRFGLPDPVFRAVSQVWRPQEGRISVSNLINPPLQLHLLKKFWDQIEEDASDRLWALLGTGLHYSLEKFVTGERLAEERLKAVVYDIEVRGRADIYHKEGVEDYKVTSVYSFLLGSKPEWEKQQNTYAFLFRLQGFPVKRLQIHALLRDWTKNKTISDPDYPKIPFASIDLTVWPEPQAEAYVKTRVQFHKDRPQAPCTDEEKWFRPGKIAVMKAGAKRALKLCDTKEEAEKFASGYCKERPKEKLSAVERPGKYVKCESYCQVRNFCEFGKSLKQEEEDAE